MSYLARRIERALVYGDPRGGPDGPRAPSFWFCAGVCLAALGVVGAAALSWVHPSARLPDDPIVLDRQSGALYVRLDDTLHPVPNLASARLIAQRAAVPRPVRSEAISGANHGAPLGIPGAPADIGPALPGDTVWSVCDGPRTTVVIGAEIPAGEVEDGHGLLVSGPSGTSYVLYDGTRAAVDVGDPAVLRALRLDGVSPLPVSAALLNTLEEASPITVPHLPGAGSTGPLQLPGSVVGDVIRVQRADKSQLFVVLAGGLQQIGGVAADLIRSGSGTGAEEIPDVAADVVSELPLLGALAVSGYPDRLDFSAQQSENVCVHWRDGVTWVTAGLPPRLPDGHEPRALAQADGDGPAVDAVYLPPGHSMFVRPGRGPGAAVLVSDNGVRFAVDTAAAGMLGLGETPVRAPGELLRSLPAGPDLTREAALLARDVIADAAPR